MYLFYSQIAIYMMLSFFTTWFSNPTTWFYLAVTGAAAFAVSRRWGTIKERKGDKSDDFKKDDTAYAE